MQVFNTFIYLVLPRIRALTFFPVTQFVHRTETANLLYNYVRNTEDIRNVESVAFRTWFPFYSYRCAADLYGNELHTDPQRKINSKVSKNFILPGTFLKHRNHYCRK